MEEFGGGFFGFCRFRFSELPLDDFDAVSFVLPSAKITSSRFMLGLLVKLPLGFFSGLTTNGSMLAPVFLWTAGERHMESSGLGVSM